ncbi:hypothetical protein [Alicyclobacillus sp. ALC3]|uniref:hypothetical protein n=1 Tax=Alicyclobacillus sp. ALC3 TaxID=2796143 RepID=UPI002379A47F|nr:hypothetical protein [Alicyclobacillus sp. ALC3]WDL97158.1 hypothetical protein JC200_23360 [Alicyclobacillus sp. ALC3]
MDRADALEEQRYGEVCRVLTEVLELWEAMKHSSMEEAGDDADRFQMKFYLLMDAIRAWIRVVGRRPENATATQSDERFTRLISALPSELQIPFELELDSMLSDADYSVDSTEQG